MRACVQLNSCASLPFRASGKSADRKRKAKEGVFRVILRVPRLWKGPWAFLSYLNKKSFMCFSHQPLSPSDYALFPPRRRRETCAPTSRAFRTLNLAPPLSTRTTLPCVGAIRGKPQYFSRKANPSPAGPVLSRIRPVPDAMGKSGEMRAVDDEREGDDGRNADRDGRDAVLGNSIVP